MIKLEDKLFLNRYLTDDNNHINIVNRDECLVCVNKPCTYVCPARVYEWDEKEKRITIAYENCVECGTCRYVCPPHVIDWRNPRGGYGIQYKFG
ncbi:ferredoxin like protein [Desulfonispora thiosulfatigenes DSM 11270]|uniref:Ferredoxin-like protein n=1 Tax=Desulfonispora thiosulfatigenes DSM 11270 TaxID=656914 RepID=A0A1W1VDQ5_DESTI|nr:4Fe-4S dicluster domain-containing protein [Desulfonispora thiosulfatigenes]SMB91455.1 ferredoxin like protein [Desulfonispora thiosulfatigenes DSM 11270]